MPEMTSHAPNTPFWVDLASPDMTASARFYDGLFSWQARQVAGPEMGNYTNFTLDGKNVAGMASLMAPGQPPAWNVYIATDNIDRIAESVRAAGGAVMMEPDDIPNAGRMGFFGDPASAAFGVMQPREHSGAQVVKEPNAFVWAELQARDVAAVTPFYQQVFGWDARSNPMGPGQPDYIKWKVQGEGVGGAMPMPPGVPAQVPAHWMPYFQVASIERSTEQVTELGGTVMVPLTDFPSGRLAVVADPHGATFGLIEAGS